MKEQPEKRALNKWAPALLKIEGVVGAGLGSRKIIVLVERALPKTVAEIPHTLDDIPVQIKEVGHITLLPLLQQQPVKPAAAIYQARTDRHRPVPGGCSISSEFTTAGTFATTVIEKKTRRILGLTANHVGGPIFGKCRPAEIGVTRIIQPGTWDGGSLETDQVGVLEAIQPVDLPPTRNLVDACVFSPTPQDVLRYDVLDVGVVAEAVEPKVNMKVQKSGRSSGVTYGTITVTDAIVDVDGGACGVCRFYDQILVEPAFLWPGDSGSWVGLADRNVSVGLGYAGSEKVSVCCKATYIEDIFGIVFLAPAAVARVPLLPLGTTLALYSAGIGTVSLGLVLKKPKQHYY